MPPRRPSRKSGSRMSTSRSDFTATDRSEISSMASDTNRSELSDSSMSGSESESEWGTTRRSVESDEEFDITEPGIPEDQPVTDQPNRNSWKTDEKFSRSASELSAMQEAKSAFDEYEKARQRAEAYKEKPARMFKTGEAPKSKPNEEESASANFPQKLFNFVTEPIVYTIKGTSIVVKSGMDNLIVPVAVVAGTPVYHTCKFVGEAVSLDEETTGGVVAMAPYHGGVVAAEAGAVVGEVALSPLTGFAALVK